LKWLPFAICYWFTLIEVANMSFRATHKYARISARKVRPLADLVRGKFADEALDILKYQPHRGARMLEKVLLSAVGNAQDPDQNKGQTVNAERLVVTDARIDGGPMFKRIRPRARGMAFGILRRTAHISVVLQSIDEVKS
jgi:large subunit ribosomal protein L22